MSFTAKKFFLICAGLSVVIFVSPWIVKKFQKKNQNFEINYEIPFQQKSTGSLSTEITTCQLPVTELKLKFESEVVLAKNFLDLPLSQQTDIDAAQMQLRYLFGYFNLNKQSNQKKIFLGSQPAEIKIIAQKPTTYPEDININNEWNDQPANSYQKHAFEKLSARKGEKAISIRYQATVSASTCGSLNKNSIEIILPKDPYLAYWAVPRELFASAQFGKSNAVISPCADAELADIRREKWFWYTWSPANEKCASQIAKSSFYESTLAITETVVTQKPVRADFFPQQNEYDVSLVFGTLFNNSIDQTMSFLKQNFNEKNIFEVHTQWSKSGQLGSLTETTVFALTNFLQELPRLVNVHDVKIEWLDDRALQIIITGTQSNEKKVRLKIYYGMTSIDFRQSPTYIQFVLDAFQNSDFVFYTGHAGMGKNFSLQFLAEKANLPLSEIQKRITTKNTQGFVIVSCYSNTYFGEDIMRFRGEKWLSTVLVRSASQDYIYHTSLGLLNFLRQADLNTYSLKSFIAPLDLGRSIFIDYY